MPDVEYLLTVAAVFTYVKGKLMLLAAFVLLIGALIAAFNLASGYVFGNIFGFSIALWGSILGTMFLALGLAVLITGPLSRRARGRRLVCFLAFISGIMVFTLAFLEPKAAIEFKAYAFREELKPLLATLALLFLPNFLMSMIIPVIAGIAVRKGRAKHGHGEKPLEYEKPGSADKSAPDGPDPAAEDDGAIPVEAVPADTLKVLEVEKTTTIRVKKIKSRKTKPEEAPVELAVKFAPPPPEIDSAAEVQMGYKLLRLHEALALLGFALGAFTTLIAVSITGDPWLVLTVVAMVLLLVAFLGAALLVKSFVTVSIIAYFILSATVFVELAPSPGFIDRVLADEEAKMKEKEKTELAADSLEVKRYSAEEVKEIFDRLADKVCAAPDKSIALTLVIDVLEGLAPGVISGSDLEKVVSDIFRDSQYRPNVMPFVESIKSVKRRNDMQVIVSLRRRMDGSHTAVLVPREDGSTLKLVFRQSFTIDIERKGSTTIVEFGPYKEKPGFLNPKYITPLKAIDVLGPIDATLISLKVWSTEDEIVLYATGQGPIGGKKEVEIVRIPKEGKIGKKSSRRRGGFWNKLICKLRNAIEDGDGNAQDGG